MEEIPPCSWPTLGSWHHKYHIFLPAIQWQAHQNIGFDASDQSAPEKKSLHLFNSTTSNRISNFDHQIVNFLVSLPYVFTSLLGKGTKVRQDLERTAEQFSLKTYNYLPIHNLAAAKHPTVGRFLHRHAETQTIYHGNYNQMWTAASCRQRWKLTNNILVTTVLVIQASDLASQLLYWTMKLETYRTKKHWASQSYPL